VRIVGFAAVVSAIRTSVREPSGRGERAEQRLRILFFLRAIHYGRVLENLLREALDRGHELHVVLAGSKRRHGDGSDALFDGLAAAYPGFSYSELAPRRGTWLGPAASLRFGLDYMRYLEAEYADAAPLRDRAGRLAPRTIRALLAFPFRGPRGRRVLGGLLRRLEAALPVPHELGEVVRDRRPDVVLVSPLVALGSSEADHLRAAAAAGIPAVFVVASWDNLSNKGALRDVPTATIVWNETQVEEAVRLHGLPRERVAAVGAHSFDHWFDWSASTTREEFLTALGLDPAQPCVLYLGSSSFIAGDEEVFVSEWLERLAAHPILRSAGAVLRPHPYNASGWEAIPDVPGRYVVWPRGGAVPETPESKREYFDTLYHADAVVGVNTSALIEAAILRKPVLTMQSDYFRTQEGTIHFSYIADDGGGSGGVVEVGHDWREHLDQLAAACTSPGARAERAEAFLLDFVRPHGLDTPAAPLAVDAVERAAASAAVPTRRPRLLGRLLLLLTPLVWGVLQLIHPRRTRRVVAKQLREARKRVRRPLRSLRRPMRALRRPFRLARKRIRGWRKQLAAVQARRDKERRKAAKRREADARAKLVESRRVDRPVRPREPVRVAEPVEAIEAAGAPGPTEATRTPDGDLAFLSLTRAELAADRLRPQAPAVPSPSEHRNGASPGGLRVPRIIHQIWLGPDPLPDELAEYVETWKRHHPDWEHRMWTEDNLPEEVRHPEVYERIRHPVERADILRWEVLSRHGGVYVDVDFECRRSLEPHVAGAEFFTALLKAPIPGKADRANNAFLGAVPRHPLVERALATLRPQEWWGFDKSFSGSVFFNALLAEFPDALILPAPLMYPASPGEEAEALAVHHYLRSWANDNDFRKAAFRAEERLHEAKGRLEREQTARREAERRLRELVASLESLDVPPAAPSKRDRESQRT